MAARAGGGQQGPSVGAQGYQGATSPRPDRVLTSMRSWVNQVAGDAILRLERVADMTNRTKVAVVGVIVGLILLAILPWWVGALVIVAAIGIPTAGYLMLDPSQRRRLRNLNRRGIGR